jgi:hypothetical protein
MLNAELGQAMTEVIASVGRAVVGHDPLDGDAVTGEPVERAADESKGAVFFLVGKQLGIGQARGIIDGTWSASQPVP